MVDSDTTMALTIIMHKIVGHGYDLLIVPFGL